MTPAQTAKSVEDLSFPSVSRGAESTAGDALRFDLIDISACDAQLLEEITNFLDSQETSHPFQLPQWSHDRGVLAVLRRGGRICWFAQCGTLFPAGEYLRPIRALTVYRGPVCDEIDLMCIGLQRLVAESRRKRFAYIEIAPEWTGKFSESAGLVLASNGWQPVPGVRSSLRLPLGKTCEQLLAGFRSTTRYKIRRSAAGGVDVSFARQESQLHEFIGLYEQMASEKQFPAEGPEFLLKVFRWLAANPGRGGFLLAWEGGKLRGGILVVRSGAKCWYILGATMKDGKFSAGHLLQWRAIEWAKENGCREYDFGGFREGMTTGPAYFKSGFSDRVVHFLPAHRYIVTPSLYRVARFLSSSRRALRGRGA
jgi:Acetyltransferase (GNAT) domain